MQFNISTIDLIIVILYFVGIVAWGLFHSSRKNAEDYFLGGRNMTWPFVGLSMFAMVVSSSALIGWAGDAYSTGISVFNYGISGGIFVLVFFLMFFLPFYLKSKVYTLPEYLEKRFDKRSRYYLSYITIIGYTFLDAAVTLYAGALVVQMVFPQAELWMIIWVLALVAASYTIIGGLTSVMYADLLQSVLLFTGSIALTMFALDAAGGWSTVVQNVNSDLLSLVRPVDDPSVPWPALFISLPILGLYYWGTSQAMVQRTLSAKNISHGRWGNLFAGFLNFAIFFFMVLPGVIGREIFPNLEKGDMIYPKLVFELLPVGLIGLVIASLLAAMASTLSAVLNSASTIFTMDIAAKFKPNMSSKTQVTVGNISGLIIIIIAALWAPQIEKFESVIKYFQQLLAFMAPPVVAVFLTGIFWKRANRHGAFIGLISGLFIALFLLLFIDITPLADLHFLYIAPIVFATSLIIIILVSLFTDSPSEEQLKNAVWTKELFIQETNDLKGVQWYKNYRILSAILVVVTIVFIYIWR